MLACSRRLLSQATGLFFVLALALVLCGDRVGMAAERPNIVLIMSDDMGYSDLGCYGSEIATPRLDALASRGLRFTQFYNMGRCCPTRASLLTGLYPHQTGVGHMMSDIGYVGYRGEMSRHCVTIAEVLQAAGYRTYLSGKWHVTKATRPKSAAEQNNWPRQRGFDRFYGTIHGGGSFFDPTSLARDNTLISPFSDSEYQPPNGFYYTDAIADQAVRFVQEHNEQNAAKPFFMYVSFTAAHWPMHARAEDIAKYRGKYAAGYEAIRAARYQRMVELGVIDAKSSKNWPIEQAWMETNYLQWDIRNMEVYAAMVDSMDRGIGRIVDSLTACGQLDNTLILFLQDNGGCAEVYGRKGTGVPRAEKPTLEPLAADYLQPDMEPKQTRDGYPIRTGKGVMAGAADTFHAYGQGWATVSNTPFREYKHWTHEGGISSPLIAHWPQKILRPGQLESTPCHVIDLMATAVDVAGASYPSEFHGGKSIKPLEGLSLQPTFVGQRLGPRDLFWEHEGNRAVRSGDFKLVAKGEEGKWELYNIAKDRSELNDLASKYPRKVSELSSLWDAYARRANVLPLVPYRKNSKYVKNKLEFTLKQGDNLPRTEAPYVPDRGITLAAHLSAVRDGVIAAQGGTTHGWAVFIRESKLCFAATHERKRSMVSSPAAISGSGPLHVQLTREGEVLLRWQDVEVGRGSVGEALLAQPDDGLQIGQDREGSVGGYRVPFTFPAVIDKVRIELQP